MKTIKLQGTIDEEKIDAVLDKIKNAGYAVKLYNSYCDDYEISKPTKKWYQFFYPSIIICLNDIDDIQFMYSHCLDEKEEYEFIREFEEKTGIELTKVI